MTTPHAESDPQSRRLSRAPWLALALLAAVLTLAPLTPGLAQHGDITPDVITATRLSTDQERIVRTYAAQHAQGLGSTDAEVRRRARARLLEPLSTPNTSVSFRLAYSGALVPELDRMTRAEHVEVRLNAIRVAGELATQDASDLVVRAIESDSVETRIMAAFALRRTFETIASQPPAMAEGRVRDLLGRAGRVVEREPDPLVFDAAVRAMTAAGGIARPTLNLRSDAYRQLAERAGERVRTRRSMNDLVGVMRTGEALLGVLRTVDGLDRQAAIAAGGFAGDALAFVRDRLAASNTPNDEDFSGLVNLAEIAIPVVAFARTVADPGQSPDAFAHAATLRENRDLTRFVESVERDILGAGGVLARPPFGFPADRFQRR